jgi:CheY-like chemotaxis protein
MVPSDFTVLPAAHPAILVVEDEMLLRMRAVDMVEDAGFTPVEAINADDALAILESRSDIELLTSRCPAAWMGSSSPTLSMSVGR